MAENEEIQAPDINSISGIQKTAILLLSLTEQDAATIIRYLDPKQIHRVGEAMTHVSDIDKETVTLVLRKFLEDIQHYSSIGFGSEDFVRNALVAALGHDRANNIVDQIMLGGGSSGLDSLKWMDPKQVASMILNEHPQIQTIVLSYLEPEHSAMILGQFPEREALDLVMRVATLEEVQPSALYELNQIMEKQFAGQSGVQAAKIGGLKAAADIMNYLDKNLETTLIDQISQSDQEMAVKIQDLMFVFENLLDVDDRGMQTILKEVPQDILIKALKGAEDNMREKIFRNMSKRAAEMLQDDLEAMGPVRISDVEAAQKEILYVARRLADTGEIMISSSGSEQFL